MKREAGKITNYIQEQRQEKRQRAFRNIRIAIVEFVVITAFLIVVLGLAVIIN